MPVPDITVDCVKMAPALVTLTSESEWGSYTECLQIALTQWPVVVHEIFENFSKALNVQDSGKSLMRRIVIFARLFG